MNTTITKSQLRNLIRESVKRMMTESSVPTYENPVFLGCESPEDAEYKVEIGYSSYSSSLYYVGPCYDEYDALESVMRYAQENGFAENYSGDPELAEEYPDDFIEVLGYPIQIDQFVVRKLTDNHGGRLAQEAFNRNITTSQIRNLVRESIRKMVNEAFQKPDNWNETEWNGTYTDEDGATYMPDDDLPEEENTDIKSEVEQFVREFSNGHQIEQWLSDNRFVDDHGFDGYIFNDEMEAEESILNGENHQNAIDYVDGATTEEEWIQILDKHSKAGTQYVRNIVEQGQWDKVVELILQIDGPAFFLAPYSGKTHDLSNGQILYY